MSVAASILNCLFTKRVIVNCDHEPYLYRWYVIRTKYVGVFIHQFVRSDEDRALHDHPWPFVVLPLWRGYIEHSERDKNFQEIKAIVDAWNPFETRVREINLAIDEKVPVRRRVLPILGLGCRSSLYRHRVELIDGKPSWSLFIRFKECRIWGFWPKEGFIAWNKWWQDKCT